MQNDAIQNDLQARWDRLCEEFQAAQGEYMELHGMLVRKFTEPGRDPTGLPPSPGDFKRAEAARARVDKIQRAMDDFVNLHCK